MDIHQIIADTNRTQTELLGRELGMELDNFGSGLAHVSILRRNYQYLKEDYAALRESYETMAQELKNLETEFLKLKSGTDWK